MIRRPVTVETTYGPVRGKEVRLPDGSTRFSVQADDARDVASSGGTTSQAIREAVWEAWRRVSDVGTVSAVRPRRNSIRSEFQMLRTRSIRQLS